MKYFYLLCGVVLLSCGGTDEKIYPSLTTVSESVYASTTVQPDSLYQAYAVVNGILDYNNLEEGAVVSKGDIILHVINTASEINAENAKLSYELSQKNYQGDAAVLQGIKDEIAISLLNFKNDSINFKRQENLWNQNIGSKVTYDNKKLAYQVSKNQLNLLKSKYDQTKNTLKTQVMQARNVLKTSQIATQDYTLTSKINGKVYALYKNRGEIVTTVEPLAAIGSASDFIIEMLIDEVDIVKLRIGQYAYITLDAYGTEVFEAKVTKIYPRKDTRTQTFKIEAQFVELPEKLYPGLAGEGNIIIATKENALTIPKEYLIEGNKVQTSEGIVEVIIGLQNLNQVEILKGINEKTEILKPQND